MSRETIESVVASVGSLSGPTTISSMYIYVPRCYLSKEESSTGQNKEEKFYSFFLCLSESRTLPLHLWQLLALTHRNVRLVVRDKGGGFVRAWAVSIPSSQGGSLSTAYRLACTDYRRGNSSGTTVGLYDW